MTHLGDVRSLILHPGTTSHVLRTEEEQRRSGIWPGLIRLSVGIEDVEDLIDDLDGAFRVLRAAPVVAAAADAEPESGLVASGHAHTTAATR
jgi:O-acetylhomoserine (thiol)-lyase